VAIYDFPFSYSPYYIPTATLLPLICLSDKLFVMAWIKWLYYWYLCMLIHLHMHTS
jgi:hypothetical protein